MVLYDSLLFRAIRELLSQTRIELYALHIHVCKDCLVARDEWKKRLMTLPYLVGFPEGVPIMLYDTWTRFKFQFGSVLKSSVHIIQLNDLFRFLLRILKNDRLKIAC